MAIHAHLKKFRTYVVLLIYAKCDLKHKPFVELAFLKNDTYCQYFIDISSLKPLISGKITHFLYTPSKTWERFYLIRVPSKYFCQRKTTQEKDLQ